MLPRRRIRYEKSLPADDEALTLYGAAVEHRDPFAFNVSDHQSPIGPRLFRIELRLLAYVATMWVGAYLLRAALGLGY